MKKRAEMTTQQIVILIVLIASFAVILFFFSKLNLGEESEKEVCHNSVVMRANAPAGGENIPLNCQRQYVCITADGSCEKMTNPKEYEVESEEEVYQVLADELADCWWMFGEGNLNYVGKDAFSELYCSICAQVAFDDSVKTEIFESGSFEKINLWNYMANTQKSEVQTYSQYLYGTNKYDEVFPDLANLGKVQLDKDYFVLMGIASSTSTWTWVGIGALATFVSVVSFGSGAPAAGALVATVAAGGVVGGTILAPVARSSESGNKFLLPWLIEANSKNYDDLGCKNMVSLS